MSKRGTKGSKQNDSASPEANSSSFPPSGSSPQVASPLMSKMDALKAAATGGQRKDSLAEAEEKLRHEQALLDEEKARLQRQKDALVTKSSFRAKGDESSSSSSSSFAPPGGASSSSDASQFSDDEVDNTTPADEALATKMQRPMRPPPKKMLKPRALSATIRRIERLPPTNKEDFPDEWGRNLNILNLHIEEEPPEHVLPGECVAIKMKIVDDKQIVRIRSAKFHRYVGSNGLLYHVKLAESEVFILARLVLGDASLELVKHDADESYEHVIESQDYAKSKSSSYYRPKAQSVYNTLGVIVEKDSICLFIRMMQPSIPEGEDTPPRPYRLLFTTLNNIDPNEFSITRKLFVGEAAGPKNRTLRKAMRRELISFLRDFDARNAQLQDQMRQFEKRVKVSHGQDPEELLISVYDTVFTLNRSITSRQNFNGATVLHYLCALGYVSVVKHVLTKLQANEINLLDINTRTPLFYAVMYGHDEIVKELIEKGATGHTKDVRGESINDIAIRMGQIKVIHILNQMKEIQLAAKKTAASQQASATAAVSSGSPGPNQSPGSRSKSTMRARGTSVLHTAARGEDSNKLEQIINEAATKPGEAAKKVAATPAPAASPEPSINGKNEEGATALHIAAASGNLRGVNMLLKAGADINALDDGDSTPLHQAVAARKIEVVKVLVEAGADVEVCDDTGGTALNLAASLNYPEIITYLLSKKANIAAVNGRGFTPLHHACAFGFLESVNVLLAAKAPVNAVASSDQSTPLHQAVFNGHHELIVPLIKAGAEVDSGNSKSLHLACFNGHLKCVEVLLAQKCNVNSVDGEKSTAMHKAAYNGHVDCMKLLIQAGAKVDPRDNEGATPLHKAAFSGKAECAKFLLDNGAAIDALDSFEGTPLHNAAFQGHTECAKVLVDRGANLTIMDDHKATVVHLAAMSGRPDTLALLVSKKAPLETQDDQGCTALMYAVASVPCVEVLMKAGAKLNAQDNLGRTAVFHAISKHVEPAAVKLIQAGADTSIKTKKGESPLDLVSPQFKDIILDAVKEARSLLNRADTATKNAMFEEGVKRWNKDGPKQAIEFLTSSGVIEKDSPDDIARFLLKENAELNPDTLGEYISHKNNIPILQAFVKRLDFENMEFDQALREFLQKFRLPGEAQLIDRCMEAFAHRFFDNNPDIFPDQDTAFIMAFSLILLNTDAHNPSIPAHKKMTKEQFLRNNRGIWAGQDPPQEYMETLYDNIVEEEIKFRDKKEPTEKLGFLKRQTGRFNWQKTWFVLRDQCLFYWKQQPKADDEQPSGVVPLENVQVKIKGDSKSKIFCVVASVEGAQLKMAKVQKGTSRIVQGTIPELCLSAETREETDAWVKAIKAQISATPFYELISQRTTELTATHVAREQLFGVGAVVDFKEFYDLALLCDSAYGSESDIKKTYGSEAVPYVGIVEVSYRYFLMKNDDLKRQQIVIVNNIFNSERVKKCYEDGQPFDWRDYFKLSDIATTILASLEPHLKKGYATQFVGHSLGGLAAVFLAHHMLSLKTTPVSKVITFGLPNFMTEKTAHVYKSLCIVRVIDPFDPVETMFPGNSFLNRQVTLLKADYFCFQNLQPQEPEAVESPVSPPASSPRGSRKDKEKDKGRKGSKPTQPEKEELIEAGTKVSKPEKQVKRAPLDPKPHLIDYYLKRMKPKLKGPVQNVDPADIVQLR